MARPAPCRRADVNRSTRSRRLLADVAVSLFSAFRIGPTLVPVRSAASRRYGALWGWPVDVDGVGGDRTIWRRRGSVPYAGSGVRWARGATVQQPGDIGVDPGRWRLTYLVSLTPSNSAAVAALDAQQKCRPVILLSSSPSRARVAAPAGGASLAVVFDSRVGSTPAVGGLRRALAPTFRAGLLSLGEAGALPPRRRQQIDPLSPAAGRRRSFSF